jgi:glycerol-3-phosphate O-acyltransferase
MDYLSTLTHLSEKGELPAELAETLKAFYSTYVNAAIENGYDKQTIEALLSDFLNLVLKESETSFVFEPYHQRIMQPIDYYHLGINFIRPLVVMKDSNVHHVDQLKKMTQQLADGDNVVLFSNHQTELDPQVISLLLEDSYPRFAEEMIFVAGHRVVSDPLAIPFSKGRNLLCIYSKKYIDADPDLKSERQLHNQRTLTRMGELLSEGGKCIYVAPSGGRDRADADGVVSVSPFDPQSIELFWLIAQRAARPTHFYPLALSTYHLLPPPEGINKTLGEERYTKATPVHIAFGEEIEMEEISEDDLHDKKQKRALRADFIWKQVCKNYERLI